jgi:hypothetical protein
VAEVQVGRGGVEAELDPQLAPGGELLCQLFLDDELVAPPPDGLNSLWYQGVSRFSPAAICASLRRLLIIKGF